MLLSLLNTWLVKHVVNPTRTLLNAKMTPFLFRHKSFWKPFHHVFWNSHMSKLKFIAVKQDSKSRISLDKMIA